MASERGNARWGFWLRWVLANIAGWAVGWGLEDLFAGAFMSEGGNFLAILFAGAFTGQGAATAVFASHWVGYIVAGAVIALAQWLVLRHRVERSGWVSVPITLAPALTLVPLAVLGVGLLVAGFAAGGADPSAPPEGADPFVGEFVAVVFGSLVLGMAAAGIARWLLVRRQIGWAGWGVLSSSVAFSVGFTTGFAFGPAGTLVMPVALVGLANGIFQWLALRGQVSRAGWWVLANTLGPAVGAAAGAAWLILLSSTLGMSIYGAASPVTFASFGAVAGAVGGAITGAVLVRLLRHPISRPSEEVAAASA